MNHNMTYVYGKSLHKVQKVHNVREKFKYVYMNVHGNCTKLSEKLLFIFLFNILQNGIAKQPHTQLHSNVF